MFPGSTNRATCARNAAEVHLEPSELLELSADALRAGRWYAMPKLVDGLQQLRSRTSTSEWHALCRDVCPQSALWPLLHRDPFTRRAHAKPRGYPGDAVCLDYIYSGLSSAEASSIDAVGRHVFAYTARLAPSAVAVRARAQRIARLIDVCAERVRAPRVLAVAAGHLREAHLSIALKAGHVGELVALDQDAQSLEVIARTYPHCHVVPAHMRISEVIARPKSVGRFDLIYALGLYDYLTDPAAVRTTQALLSMLNPGGNLLLANFVPDFLGSAYMEAFMHWPLVCRTPDALAALAAAEGVHVQADLYVAQCIAYVLATKVEP